MSNERLLYLNSTKRIVVKIGTSSLTYENGLLNILKIESLVRELSDLHNRGYELLLVTSGAIGAGMGRLGLKSRPKSIPEKQAAAAVGQGVLLHMYEKLFSEYGIVVAQILLTKDDIANEQRYKNAKNACSKLLKMGVIPIINENDAVVIDEIKFGDNDTLSALVTCVIDADLLVILSDIDGLYSSNPKDDKDAKLISCVEKIDSAIEASAGGIGSNLGTGGMITKIHAAKIATEKGKPMVILNSNLFNGLNEVISGKEVGTWFNPCSK